MGCWIKARHKRLQLRDGREGFASESKSVGFQPVWFEFLDAEHFEGDPEIIVLKDKAPPAEKERKAIHEAFERRSATLKTERGARIAAQQAEKARKDAEKASVEGKRRVV
ncbi:MAG: hypothetical protein RL139_900 [Gemmatimonadota bacterium]|jgi:hypothetical protein